MNFPNQMPPIFRGSITDYNLSLDLIIPSEICADGTCDEKQCCVKKFGITKCLPNTFGYTGPIRCCGSIASQKGCCTTPDGRKFCN